MRSNTKEPSDNRSTLVKVGRRSVVRIARRLTRVAPFVQCTDSGRTRGAHAPSGLRSFQPLASKPRRPRTGRGLNLGAIIAQPTSSDFCAAKRSLQRCTEMPCSRTRAALRMARSTSRNGLDLNTTERRLRALAVLRWTRDISFDSDLGAESSELLRADLEFTCSHWHEPSYDIWEEEQGLHCYTLCVSAAALEAGADCMESRRRLGGGAVLSRTSA